MDGGRAQAGRVTLTADVVVLGAGTFGAWSAWHLTRAGHRVVLLDPHGPGNARASSGGETRIIRMGYGADEAYTRFAQRSLDLWRGLFSDTGHALFHRTGVLWLAPEGHPATRDTVTTLGRLGVPHELLGPDDLARRYPQISFEEGMTGLVEPESGALMARRAIEAVVEDAVRQGCEYRLDGAVPLTGAASGHLHELRTLRAETCAADVFIFAAGPWLPKVLPDVVGERIFPTRQEVFFFGTPAGDPRFSPPACPTWIDFGRHEAYGMPDLDGRGFKVGLDRHGPPFDPDTGDRLPSAEGLARARACLAGRFPALTQAPLLEARVCQYENTSNGDFIVDRHPAFDNVWIVGGGSGHGFKHGPAVGEYCAGRIFGDRPEEPRFALSPKKTEQNRTVF
jgi:sarcosine oxidase